MKNLTLTLVACIFFNLSCTSKPKLPPASLAGQGYAVDIEIPGKDHKIGLALFFNKNDFTALNMRLPKSGNTVWARDSSGTYEIKGNKIFLFLMRSHCKLEKFEKTLEIAEYKNDAPWVLVDEKGIKYRNAKEPDYEPNAINFRQEDRLQRNTGCEDFSI